MGIQLVLAGVAYPESGGIVERSEIHCQMCPRPQSHNVFLMAIRRCHRSHAHIQSRDAEAPSLLKETRKNRSNNETG